MHEAIRFHKNIFEISLFNLQAIKKAYSDILGLQHIVHLSINIIDPTNQIMFLSATPNTGINVCGTNLWRFDSSISPVIYKYHKFYFWDDCYQKKAFWELKIAKELVNGIRCGFIVVEEIDNYCIMYSYGLDQDNVEIREQITGMQKYFTEMGQYCFKRVSPIYEKYDNQSNLLKLLEL